MNKTYSRINWENYPSDKTPLNETNLNQIDYSTNEIDDRVITLDTVKASKEEVATTIISVEFNEKNGIFTFTRKNGSKFMVDTLLEKLAINFDYDEETQKIIIYLEDGTSKEIDLSALITQYEFLDTDTVSFFIGADGKVSAIVKDGSITEDKLQPNYLAEIKVQAANAGKSAADAALSADTASDKADLCAEKANTATIKAEEAYESAATATEQAAEAVRSAKSAAELAGASAESAAEAGSSAASAGTSANTAAEKATEASVSADSASASRKAAKASETNAKTSETNAASSALAASDKAGDAAVSATTASEKAAEAANSANSASNSANTATAQATIAKSYAVGGTGTRTGEDTDNAEYYKEQAAESADSAGTSAGTAAIKATEAGNSADIAVSKATEAGKSALESQKYATGDTDSARYYYEQTKSISEGISGSLRPMGTVTFANLPKEATAGDMYNVRDQFTTTSDFKEGAGNVIPAGANVYKTVDGFWDILAGTPVTSVNGMRGNVELNAETVGAIPAQTKYAGSDSVGGAANNLKNFRNSNNVPVDVNDFNSNGIGYVNGTSGIMGIPDGAMFGQKYSDDWQAQIYQDYRSGQIALRGKNNGTWQNWRKVYDSENYESIPTSTGDKNGLMSHEDKSKLDRLPSAHYGTTGQNSGYYKIKIKEKNAWMLCFTVRLYQGYRATDMMISGYNYGNYYWYQPSAVIMGDSAGLSMDVVFGYDAAYELWIAVPAGMYTGLDIFNVTNGYQQLTSVDDAFDILYEQSLTGTGQTVIRAYPPLLVKSFDAATGTLETIS